MKYKLLKYFLASKWMICCTTKDKICRITSSYVNGKISQLGKQYHPIVVIFVVFYASGSIFPVGSKFWAWFQAARSSA